MAAAQWAMDKNTMARSSLSRVGAENGPWPLHSVAATGLIEHAAALEEAPHTLMQRAGLAVARLAIAMAPHAWRVTVLAGPGNNGGDGLVAAVHLQRAGRQVQVHLLADVSRLPADAALALQQAQAEGVSIDHGPVRLENTDLVIDALLGLGARRPAGDDAADSIAARIAVAITAINGSCAPVLAIDLPSGLNADTGTTLGGATVRATVRATATLSLLTLKPGLCTAEGRDHVGELWFDDLGVAPTVFESAAPACGRLTASSDIHFLRQPRAHASHKGSYGDVAVVGGAPGMQGAAWLAAHAALGAGAGRVYVSLLDGDAPLFDPTRPELMVRKAWWLMPAEVLEAATVVCGCGGGSEVGAALPTLLARAGRLLLDADALNAIANDVSLQARLQARAGHGLQTVLTPHPLEAARLLGIKAFEVQQDRLAAAQTLVEKYRCVVVLKGSGSIVAEPAALPTINPTGNALLASAGTGDVLAGFIGGLWAACAASSSGAAAARAAVWLHGRAADQALRHSGAAMPMRAADLTDAMRSAVDG